MSEFYEIIQNRVAHTSCTILPSNAHANFPRSTIPHTVRVWRLLMTFIWRVWPYLWCHKDAEQDFLGRLTARQLRNAFQIQSSNISEQVSVNPPSVKHALSFGTDHMNLSASQLTPWHRVGESRWVLSNKMSAPSLPRRWRLTENPHVNFWAFSRMLLNVSGSPFRHSNSSARF
jgi:hypothetical protein